MNSQLLGVAGTWLLADGIFSLLTHTRPPLAQHQDWLHDHSIRLVRMALGVFLMAAGWGLR